MPRAKGSIDTYFAKMQEFAEGNKLPPRLRNKLLGAKLGPEENRPRFVRDWTPPRGDNQVESI
ncbi:hypothetical protein FS837_003831 [Tulasnella sp. UAMH 9824]|nr:hypothetical protein FS837_003831 [Tulasnella sp. UAMH 9824]